MDDNFLEAVKNYFCIVENACNLLMEYFNQEDHEEIVNKYELCDYLYLQKHVFELMLDERRYYFHGVGCTVFVNDVPMIDWDFGYRSWWCGIEPYKMARTLKSFLYKNEEFYNGTYIEKKCKEYVIVNKLYLFKGQYYVNLLSLGYKKIDFPSDYDTLVVEYKGISKSYSKCKYIDKFVRKSIKIYDKIDELKNNYTLTFYCCGKVVSRILYNDLAYPESAVKIMNGEIIKPHKIELWKREN